jgi:zinc protease
MNKNILLLLVLMLGIKHVTAQQIAIREDVRVGKLENGLTYYIHPNKYPSNKLELRLVLAAGSLQETESQRGVAHFCEHMLFNGTKSYPQNTLIEHLESFGLSFGADINAHTGFDQTIYYLPIPTDNKQNIDEGFKILREWASEALFTEKDIDAERGVILEEKRSRNDANMRFIEKVMKKSYPLAYAERLPIGTDSVLLYAPYKEFIQFYKDWYRPNLMAIVVVGDITFEEGEILIKKHFESFKNPKIVIPIDEIDVPKFEKNLGIVLSDKEATAYNVEILFSKVKSPDYKTIQTYRSSIIEKIIFQAINNRYAELSKLSKPVFMLANVGWDEEIIGYRGLSLDIKPAKDIHNAIKYAVLELNRVSTFGITPEELNYVKMMLKNQIDNDIANLGAESSNDLLEYYIAHFLYEKPIEGPKLKADYYRKMLPSITLEEVNSYAKKIIDKNETFVVSITGPDTRKVKMPTDREAVKLVTDAMNEKSSQYVSQKNIDKLMSDDDLPTIQNGIVKEWKDDALDIYYLELGNGVKVAYKKTITKPNEIVMSAANYGGLNKYHTASNLDKENSYFVANFISQFGINGKSNLSISNFLNTKSAHVNLSLEQYSNHISGKSNLKDFEMMLQLVYLKLTAINSDTIAFENILSKVRTNLDYLKSNPMNTFLDTLGKVIYNNSPLVPIQIPTEDVLRKISLNKVMQIYANEFKDQASNYVFSFVGNIDDATFKKLVTKYLGGLPKAKTPSKLVDNGLRKGNGYKEIQIPGFASDDQAIIYKSIYAEMPYNYDLSVKANMIVEILNKRVNLEIRENMGAMYSGQVFLDFAKLPYGNYELNFFLPCAYANVQKVMDAIGAEINKMKKDGVNSKELNIVKKQMIENYKSQMEVNREVAEKIIQKDVFEEEFKTIDSYTQYINKIGEKDIYQTIQLILGNNNSNVLDAILIPKQ